MQVNPKRPHTGAHDRYDRYKVAKTVGEATLLGATAGDLKNDRRKRYLITHLLEAQSPGSDVRQHSRRLQLQTKMRAGAEAPETPKCGAALMPQGVISRERPFAATLSSTPQKSHAPTPWIAGLPRTQRRFAVDSRNVDQYKAHIRCAC